MPERADLEPAEMLPFLPHVLLFDVLRREGDGDPEPRDFRYRLVGTAVEHHMGQRYTGRVLSEQPHQREGSRIWSTFMAVARDGMPRHNHVPYVGPHADFLGIEDVLMPLGRDGSVSMLFAVVDFIQRRPAA